LTRRYAAKLVIEVENFRLGRLKKGQSFYSKVMGRETWSPVLLYPCGYTRRGTRHCRAP